MAAYDACSELYLPTRCVLLATRTSIPHTEETTQASAAFGNTAASGITSKTAERDVRRIARDREGAAASADGTSDSETTMDDMTATLRSVVSAAPCRCVLPDIT